jgi:hypothetical protein
VIPVLDNQVGKRNQEKASPGELTLEEAVDLLKVPSTHIGYSSACTFRVRVHACVQIVYRMHLQ